MEQKKGDEAMKKTAVITGGSGGIGLAAADALSEAGYAVYELSRGGKSRAGVVHITADVTDERAIQRALEEVCRKAGRIDVAVSNAGFGISGATEFTGIDEARRLFDVNLFGAAAFAKAALPYLRETRGRLIFVGSVAGQISIPFQSYYSASKAAVLSLCEAIRNEVRPFGVSACCMMPGDVRTGFTAARSRSTTGDDLYAGRIARSVAVMEKDEQNGMPPRTVARAIVRAAKRRRVAPVYTVGAGYKLLVFLTRLLPRSLTNYIVGLIYAR